MVTGALLPMATLAMVAGRLGDRFGRRRIFVAGLWTFGAASIPCGLAPNETVMILARAAQGIGCALAVPLTLSHLAVAFPVAKRGWAFGLATTAITTMTTLAPLGVGIAVDFLNWRWVFLVNAPVAAILAVAARRVLHERREADPAPLDLRGCALLGLSLTMLVVAFEDDTAWGVSDWKTLTLISLGVVGLTAFVVHEIRTEQPLLRLDLLKNRTVYIALSVLAVVQCASLVVSVNSALYLQHVEDLSAFFAALVLLASSVGTIVGAPWGGRLTDKGYGGRVLAFGMAACAGGTVLLLWAVQTHEHAVFVVGLLLVGLGPGLVYSPASTLMFSALRASEQGLASSLTVQARQIGATLGFSVVQTVLTEVEWSHRRGMPVTHDIPHSRLDAIFNGSDAGRALLAKFASTTAGRISTAVNDCYIYGLSAALACLAAVLVAGSVLTALGLRARPAGPK